MGGYEAPGTGNVLDFTGTKHEGLDVTVDSMPLGLMLDVIEKYEVVANIKEGTGDFRAALPLIASLIDDFGGVLESWNVTRRGEPVPATPEGLRSLDAIFVMEILGAWVTGSAEAGDELGKDLTSGGISQEVLTAAAGLSSSLAS